LRQFFRYYVTLVVFVVQPSHLHLYMVPVQWWRCLFNLCKLQ